MRYLEKDSFYMNIQTGSVNTGYDWEADFNGRDKKDFPTWEDWGGDSLIEVKKDESGEWVECEQY